MKTKTEKRKLSSIIVVSVCLLAVVSLTLAMFSSIESVSRLFTVSNFVSEGKISFDGVSDMSSYETDNGIEVSLNSADPNYIGKLRVAVSYSGYGVGLARVRIVEQWSTVDSEGVRHIMPYSLKMPYVISSVYEGSGNQKAWFDNRENDYRFYYATPVKCSSGTPSTLSLIEGFDVNSIDIGAIADGTQLHIIIETEVVQVNRYPQFWGMSQLPWANGVSATEELI